MCGIVGFWDPSRRCSAGQDLLDLGQKMGRALVHRGPDDQGVWIDPSQALVLVHQRLSIRDLSIAGHQPMVSASGRFVIVFNGEIYNTTELISFLPPLKSTCDTEVLLEACEKWGAYEACQRVLGMFAFVLWDRKEHILYCARDHVGEKPLYYGWHNGIFFFTSELKALRPHPAFKPEICSKALSAFFRFSYVPDNVCIFKDFSKILPGQILVVKQGREIHKKSYWDLSKVWQETQVTPSLTKQDAVETFGRVLRQSVQERLMADVPVGVFLSSGIDSSLVTALAQELLQEQGKGPVSTFSIGFYDPALNEAPGAAKIAQYLGTRHHEKYLGDGEILTLTQQLSTVWDEPFADSSQIPTLAVCQLAAQQGLKVCLGGDGGDEILAGYTRYKVLQSVWPWARWIPSVLRKGMCDMLRKLPFFQTHFFQKGFFVLGQKDLRQMYQALCSLEYEAGLGSQIPLLSCEVPYEDPFQNIFQQSFRGDFVSKIQLLDLLTYLPGDILTKVDRASMAVGLEVRGPFLDRRVQECSFGIPECFKIRAGQTKWVARQLLYQKVPQALLKGSKKGFAVPIHQLLKGSLKSWAWDLLDPKVLEDSGLNAQSVHQIWDRHQKGAAKCGSTLWTVLMYLAWHQTYRNSLLS